MINLFDTILYIIHHIKINKKNKKDLIENPNKVVLTNKTPQVPRKIYIT